MSEYKFCPLCKSKLIFKKEGDFLNPWCKKCDVVYYNNPRPTVSAVIEKGNQILLTKRAFKPFKDKWDLPGGFLEGKESVEEGLFREIKEELNIIIKIKKYLGSYPDLYHHDKAKGFTVNIYFIASIKNGNVKVCDDVKEAKFFNLNNLPRLAFKNGQHAIKDYLKDAKRPKGLK